MQNVLRTCKAVQRAQCRRAFKERERDRGPRYGIETRSLVDIKPNAGVILRHTLLAPTAAALPTLRLMGNHLDYTFNVQSMYAVAGFAHVSIIIIKKRRERRIVQHQKRTLQGASSPQISVSEGSAEEHRPFRSASRFEPE